MRRNAFVTTLLVFVTVLVTSPAEATIQRIDACGGQFTPDQAITIVRNQSGGTDMIVRGDLVDTITGVLAPPGFDVTIGPRTGGGGTSTSVSLKVKTGPSTAIGDHYIKLNYAVELGRPDVFKVRVKRINVSSISASPSQNVHPGTEVTITVNGTGLNNLGIKPVFDFEYPGYRSITTNNSSTYVFAFRPTSSVTISSDRQLHDSSLGGYCGYLPYNEAGVALGVRKADLRISAATGVYRFFSQPEICAGVARLEVDTKYCNALSTPMPAPTTSTPHVEQVQHVGGIVYIVTNPLGYLVTTPFKVQLRNGSTVLKEDVINGLEGGGHKVLTYSRPSNQRKLMQNLSCPNSCYDLDVAPYNWKDPIYTTVVDVDNAVDEGTGETNNTVTSQ
jgi:hypothetical protein